MVLCGHCMSKARGKGLSRARQHYMSNHAGCHKLWRNNNAQLQSMLKPRPQEVLLYSISQCVQKCMTRLGLTLRIFPEAWPLCMYARRLSPACKTVASTDSQQIHCLHPALHMSHVTGFSGTTAQSCQPPACMGTMQNPSLATWVHISRHCILLCAFGAANFGSCLMQHTFEV